MPVWCVSEERLISADSHVAITHEQVRAHLARAFHPDYDEAVAAFTQRMACGTAAANQAGMTMKRSDSNGISGPMPSSNGRVTGIHVNG